MALFMSLLILLANNSLAQGNPPSGDVILSSNTSWPEATYQLNSLMVNNGATLKIGGGSIVNVSGAITVTANSAIVLQGKDTSAQVDGLWQGAGVTINADTVQVDQGSAISADAQGYVGSYWNAAASGPGGALGARVGGTYGGTGANSSGIATYGSLLTPTDLGSGGTGNVCGFNPPGGNGGGAVRLIVSGTLTNNGIVSANGGNADCASAGGSGGSVYITAGALTGSGVFTANGGASSYGGGGGRVAVHCSATSGYTGFTTSTANGGNGAGTGTVVFVDDTKTDGDVHIYQPVTLNPDTVAIIDTLTVTNGATLTIGGGSNITVTGTWTVTGNSTVVVQSKNYSSQVNGQWQGVGATISATNLQIDAGSKISADAQGYSRSSWCATAAGPGGGVGCAVGGTYGGLGMNSGLPIYGSATAPVDLGSGGSGNYCYAGPDGGNGGGAIRLIVSGTLTNNGVISANGGDGACASGGGSGGSVYVTTGNLTGSGIFTANGGASDHGGGGGRFAVYYAVATNFTGFDTSTASGGTGAQTGTGFFVDTTKRDVYVNQGLALLPDTVATYDALTVLNGSTLTIGGGSAITVTGSFKVTGKSTVIVQSKNTTAQVNGQWQGAGATISAANVQIDADSHLSADGQGYVGMANLGGLGPGAGAMHAGAGYGGVGGAGGDQGGGVSSPGGAAYGAAVTPVELGSSGGGGEGCGYCNGSGGAGGGGIRLIVSGTLTHNGTISANGVGAPNVVSSGGGGAGGSVFIDAGTITGAGTIQAQGGNGGYRGYAGWFPGGAGSGGRVALYYVTNGSFNSSNLTAKGGAGGGGDGSWPTGNGSDGTVIFSNTPQFLWIKPASSLLHGTERLEWTADAIDLGNTTVDVAESGKETVTLGSGLSPISGMDWDTTTVPDGRYELRLTFRDANGNVISQTPRTVLITNSSMMWHSGIITSSETWSADHVHGIDGTVIIPSGVTVTIAPGTVVKALKGAQILIQSGGALIAVGIDTSRIVITTIDDDSVAGDTNADGTQTKPIPGQWLGIIVQSGGQLNVNNYTDIRYVQSTQSGALPSSQTWLGSQLYHITGDVTVPNGAILAIQPGAILKFDFQKRLIVQPGGQLVAQGTAAQPIYFTSIKDDSVGGDTNGDGNASAPAPGDWWFIYVDDQAQASFDHVVVSYGGGNPSSWGYVTGLIQTLGTGSVTLSNSILQHSLNDGIDMQGGTATVTSTVVSDTVRGLNAQTGSTAKVVNSTFDGNGTGVLYHGGAIDLENSLIANSKTYGINFCCGSPSPVVRYSDVWSSVAGSVNYNGTPDLTGTSGNISADPKFKNGQQGDYRLDFRSPAIDAADGTVAPPTDFMGAPRYDDPRTPNTGLPAANGGYPDLGAFESVETSASDIDLVVASVTGPVSAVAGTQAQVSWTINNIGVATAIGPWHDAVYLVRDSDTNPIEILAGEVLVGQGVILGPGASYEGSGTFRVPGSVVGNHRWEVKTNTKGEVFEGQNTANNIGTSLATVAIDLPELVVDAPAQSNSFTAVGQSWWYKLKAGPNKAVGVNLALASSGAVQLFIGQGYVPDSTRFDFQQQEWNSASASAVIPNTTSQIYYVTAYSQALNASSEAFTIAAKALAFSLSAVEPTSVSNAGPATMEFIGAQLRSDGIYQIVGPDNATHPATSVYLADEGHAYATFAMSGLPAGSYTAQVTENGTTVSLASAFIVANAASNPSYLSYPVEFDLEVPALLRAGFPGMVTIHYKNIGTEDVPAPLLRLAAQGADLSLIPPTCSGCSPNYELAYQNSAIPGYLLGINPEGPAGVLPPGAEGSITLKATPSAASGNVAFSLDSYGDSTETIDWGSLKESLRPSHVDATAWDAIFANFTAVAGATWGDFNALLAQDATYLRQLGQTEYRAAPLFTFELRKAGLGTIERRYALGSFGRGRSHLCDIWAESSGGLVVHYPAGIVRTFVPLPNSPNRYVGLLGDYGSAVYGSADQTWVLTEPDGTGLHFVADSTQPGRFVLDFIQDLNNNTTTLQYTASLVSGVVNSNGDSIGFTRNGLGRITQMTDPLGRVTSYTYDSSGDHLLSVTDSRGTVSFSYVTGQSAAQEHALQSVTYRDGTHLNFDYDTQGRLLRIYRDAGAQLTTLAYDSMGGIAITDALGNSSHLFLDQFANLSQLVDPLAQSMVLSYDPEAKPIYERAPAGETSFLGYDASGNLNALLDPLGKSEGAKYSAHGRLLSLTNTLGNTLTFGYDARYNATIMAWPNGQAERATYDSRGNLTTWTNRRGKTVTFTYDSKNLLTQKSFADGSHVDYAYDGHRNLLTAATSSGTTSFTYDSADRLTSIVYPNGRFLQFSYDAGGRRIGMVDQSGFVVNYAYDAVGRLSRITNGSGSAVAAYSYDAAGRLARKDLGNGAYSTFDYDAASRLLHLVNYAPTGSVNSRFDYSYDGDGRKIAVTTLEGKWTYGYDSSGQLISVGAASGSSVQYEYDAAGNRTTMAVNGSVTSYNANRENQYTTAGGAAYLYDADGNLAGKTDSHGTAVYTYDDEDRLVGISGPYGIWTYEYDVLGNRVAQTHAGTRTEYLVDPAGVGAVVAEFDGTGKILNHYSYGLDLAGAVAQAGTVGYYQFDGSGNTVQITGSGGTVLNGYSYLPYGETVVGAQALSNPFTFAGQLGVMDGGNGLYFMRHRWYDSALGRFIQQDPLGIVGGDANLYRYAGNAPLDHTDAEGLEGHGATLDNVYSTLGNSSTVSSVAGGLTGLLENASKISPGSYVSKLGSTPVLKPITNAAGNVLGKGELLEGPATKFFGSKGAGGVLNVAGSVVSGTQFGISAYNYTHGKPGSGLDTWHDGAAFAGNLMGFIPVYGTAISTGITAVDLGSQALLSQYYTNLYGPGVPQGWKAKHVVRKSDDVGHSADPNGKLTVGFGDQGFIPPGATIAYTIFFENMPTATAPAAIVKVTDPLNSNLDWSTVQLSQIAFNNVTINVPGGLQNYTGQATVSTDANPVNVTAALDPGTGTLTWTMQSVDPVTGHLPTGPLAGFLPPDDAAHRGSGFLSFTVKPKSGLANGTTITNQAAIVFDVNPPINTNQVTNTIDSIYPTSSVDSMPATTGTPSFTVSWAGADASGSGIAGYDIYLATDGGPFGVWLASTSQTSATFNGAFGHTYTFYSIVTDNVGHRQPVPGATQTTTVQAPTVASATSLTSSANPADFGVAVTFTAAVTASGSSSTAKATGTVTFMDGATHLGTATLNPSGMATHVTSSLTAGNHPITAVYGGDTNYTGSTSPVLNQTVNVSAATVASATSLTSSANPADFGVAVTFTAAVTASGSSSTAKATGTVT
ncbi:MAG: Ig-like domain repeat protein, partial [Acidobacteriia bacterium]|nr:Ig-like domain repeat protein [Terriglobia bacterium]